MTDSTEISMTQAKATEQAGRKYEVITMTITPLVKPGIETATAHFASQCAWDPVAGRFIVPGGGQSLKISPMAMRVRIRGWWRQTAKDWNSSPLGDDNQAEVVPDPGTLDRIERALKTAPTAS